MKNNRILGQVLLAKSLTLGTLVILSSGSRVWAIDPADDAGVFGSITIARQAREGAKAINARDYTKAIHAYCSVIDLKSDVPEFYYGLLYAGQKAEDWNQVTRALAAITEQDPSAKEHLSFEFGDCYTKLGMYDEALPMLKAALKNSEPNGEFVNGKLKKLLAMTKAPAPPVVRTQKQIDDDEARAAAAAAAAAPPPKVPIITDKDLNPDSTDRGAGYLDAFLHSEWIGIGEYKGYDKKDPILFNGPPIAHYKLTKCLIGPPLNPDLPVRYKFYEYDGAPKPQGWKFTPDKMPKPGSRWLLFIPAAVVREGAFDTYKGSFGRQEANDDNLGKILEIIESHHGQ